MFTAIATTDGPVLIHCAGGRDRTGLVVSMLLSLTGVEPAAVAATYEHGFRGAGEYAGHGLSYDPDAGRWVPTPSTTSTDGELTAALADRTPTLRRWLEQTDVAGYLRGAGLAESQVRRLRHLLRETG